MASNLAHRREILQKAFERMGIESADTYELVEAIVTPVEASQEFGNQGERLDEHIDTTIKSEGKRLDAAIDGVDKRLSTLQAMVIAFGILISLLIAALFIRIA